MYNYYDLKENLKPEEVLIYLRKSRTDDPSLTVEEVLSRHESLLDEWVARNLNAPIPECNRLRELVSGESISEREVFRKLLKLVENPSIKAVLVVDLPRLGRPDTSEIGLISKIFRYTHTHVITRERMFNLSDDFEREMFETELKRGNFYLESTKKQLGRGREVSVKSGNYICSKSPYGYNKITITENKRRCPTLEINEEQANVVRMIFNSYVHENIGTQTIANRLNDLNIKPPQGAVWTADSIRTIIENPVHAGMTRWNERKAILIVDNGEFRKTRRKTNDDERILSKGKHPAIISEELFYEAQGKRGRTHRTCNNKELRNPLASLLFCECGKAMSYRDSTRRGKSRNDPRLVCNGQKYCGSGSCSVYEVIDFVADVLRQRIAEFEVELKKGDTDSDKFHDKMIKTLEKKLTDIDARELSLWESQVDPDLGKRMPPHIFQSITDKLTKEREETVTALEKARKAITAPIENKVKKETFQNALDALLDDSVSIAEKNHLLKACIDRIVYHREAPQRISGGRQRYTSPPIDLEVKLKL